MEIKPIISALMRNKTGAILVALQVAISLAILANALHIVSVRREAAARPSGVAHEEQVFSIFQRNLNKMGHEEELASLVRARDALRGVPGVESVAETSQIPMSWNGSNTGVAVDPKQDKTNAEVSYYLSAENLIGTWGLKLEAGRDFNHDDVLEMDGTASNESPKVTIITRKLAEKLWPGADPIGKTLWIGVGSDASAMRVIGVVTTLQTYAAETSERGEFSMIMPVRQTGFGYHFFTVRAGSGQIESVMKDAEEALRKAAGAPVVVKARALSDERKDRYRSDMAMSWMLITVSVLLLLITASGIVGMASLWVTQRRKQIGVRRALGARKLDILRYFITENLLITSLGVVGGVLGAVGLNTLLVSQFEMKPMPYTYLLLGALLFWSLGILAVYGPAWRAASISPAMATRST